MKCVYCGKKYPTKGVERCPNVLDRICLRCNILGKGKHRCDLDCPGGRLPSLRTYPLTDSVMGMSPTGEIRGTVDEFLPRGFSFVCCQNVNIKVEGLKFQRLKLSVEFTLSGSSTLEGALYSYEGWKWQHVKNILKRTGIKSQSGIMAPVFIMNLWEGLRVCPETAKLTIDGQEEQMVVNPDVDFVGLPDCWPPPVEYTKPSGKKYTYFVGKFSCFYAPFLIGKRYHVEFLVEAINFYYEIGFLFPYRYTEISVIEHFANLPLSLDLGEKVVIGPLREDVFPPKQEHEWVKRRSPAALIRPWINPADPFRRVFLRGVGGNPTSVDENPSLLSEYGLLLTRFPLAVQKGKDFIVDVEVTDTPIPVRVYDQLQKLPYYHDSLIRFDIINFSENYYDIEVSSEILGYTEKEIGNFHLPAMGSGKPSRLVFSQCPKLARGVLETINHATEATLKYEIYIKENGQRKLQERETRLVRLLPHDMIIWEIKDPKGSGLYDLSKFIGAWIVPNDSGGLMDQIRGSAKEYHPDGILVGGVGGLSLEKTNLQVKALYDYLNDKSGISYVNQAFNFGFNTGAQRVVLPDRVVKAKTGNCIDLTVLFSSLMEGMGITPLVMLMPGHAFLAWGNKADKDQMGFMETTRLGAINPLTGNKYTFNESYDYAKSVFLDKFILKGGDNYLPLFSATFSKERYLIVDIEEVRKNGIYFSK